MGKKYDEVIKGYANVTEDLNTLSVKSTDALDRIHSLEVYLESIRQEIGSLNGEKIDERLRSVEDDVGRAIKHAIESKGEYPDKWQEFKQAVAVRLHVQDGAGNRITALECQTNNDIRLLGKRLEKIEKILNEVKCNLDAHILIQCSQASVSFAEEPDGLGFPLVPPVEDSEKLTLPVRDGLTLTSTLEEPVCGVCASEGGKVRRYQRNINQWVCSNCFRLDMSE